MSSASLDTSPPLNSVDIARLPWIFTQTDPLETSGFLKEAKRRGFSLDVLTLRELYRQGLVVPFLQVRSRRVADGRSLPGPILEPIAAGTILGEIRLARDRGRLADPAKEPFRRTLQFEQPQADQLRWWNGLVYSRYQLLALPRFKREIQQRVYVGPSDRRRVRLGKPHPFAEDFARSSRDLALVLTTLEPMYLPRLDREFVHLVSASVEEWEDYRNQSDPRETLAFLRWSPARILAEADRLLMRAKRDDPMGRWARLLGRSNQRYWKSLTGGALLALDFRVAAEILLLFYEDLHEHGAAPPLEPVSRRNWHPMRERISDRTETLDEILSDLGVSPHPRVVLVVEGETEEYFVPRVWDLLGLRRDRELLAVVNLRGVKGDLTKLVAFAAAPLVGEAYYGEWRLIKPPTTVYVIVDPEEEYATPEGVAESHKKAVNEIETVTRSQGADPERADIEALIEIHTWSDPCFEFAHFSDAELANGLLQIHAQHGDLDHAGLTRALKYHRDHGEDIKAVWSKWRPKVSKLRLAEFLWPVLAAKIGATKESADAPVPPLVEHLARAYHLAQSRRNLSFVLPRQDQELG